MSDTTKGTEAGQQPEELNSEALEQAVGGTTAAHDDESPKETVTFEYGGLQVRYGQQ